MSGARDKIVAVIIGVSIALLGSIMSVGLPDTEYDVWQLVVLLPLAILVVPAVGSVCWKRPYWNPFRSLRGFMVLALVVGQLWGAFWMLIAGVASLMGSYQRMVDFWGIPAPALVGFATALGAHAVWGLRMHWSRINKSVSWAISAFALHLGILAVAPHASVGEIIVGFPSPYLIPAAIFLSVVVLLDKIWKTDGSSEGLSAAE